MAPPSVFHGHNFIEVRKPPCRDTSTATIGIQLYRPTSIWGGQTEFCPNGEHKLFVTRPRQGEKNYDELWQWVFFDGRRVLPDERLLCCPARNVSHVDGYLLRSVTQLVKQMCYVLPE